MKYKAYAVFKDNNDENAIAYFAVPSFEVKGGAYREITLASATDMSISSEMEQARAYKNISFYKLPGTDFTDVGLMNIYRDKTSFILYFMINAFKGRTPVQSLMLRAESATLASYPTVVGSKPRVLWIDVKILSAKLLHDRRDKSGNTILEEW